MRKIKLFSSFFLNFLKTRRSRIHVLDFPPPICRKNGICTIVINLPYWRSIYITTNLRSGLRLAVQTYVIKATLAFQIYVSKATRSYEKLREVRIKPRTISVVVLYEATKIDIYIDIYTYLSIYSWMIIAYFTCS